jgi:hypothetical protein
MKNKSAFTLGRKQNFVSNEPKIYFLKRGSTCHGISSTTSLQICLRSAIRGFLYSVDFRESLCAPRGNHFSTANKLKTD